MIQDRVVFKIEFTIEFKDSFWKVIFNFKLERQVLSFPPRFFPSSLPHIDMQDNVVEVRIAGMPMSVPVGGIDMQFDIAFISFSVYLDGRAGEVGALTKIPVSGINDFQILALPGFERRRAKQLVVPDTADDFFWNPDGVVFFPNLQLIVEMGELQVGV